jgi:DNA-directed RNA polymerase subunit RPC12/RpoP
MVTAMAKKQERKQLQNKLEEYTINLATVEGDGSFACPRCGNTISPEDETENNYQILDTKVLNDELVELAIACGKCGSRIVLSGFQTPDS